MQRMVLLSLVVLLSFGFSLSGGAFSTPAWAVERGDPKPKKKDGEEEVHPDFEYVQMDPLNLPIITNKGLTQQVSLLVSLEIPWGGKDDITHYKPRLADAYLQDLYGALGAGHALMKGDLIDVEEIRTRLTSVTGKVLGPERKVNGVLLQVVQQRPM